MKSESGVGAPISVLPPESLCQIFLACRDAEIQDSFGPMSSPALLIRVCRYWRNLICGTPILWTKLNVGVDTLRLKNPALLISLCAACSSMLPIEVRIDSLACSESTDSIDRFELVAPSLEAIFPKCSLLHFTMSMWQLQIVQRLFPPGTETSLPILESLRVHALAGKIHAPRLRRLSSSCSEDLKHTLGAARDSLRDLSMSGLLPIDPNTTYFHKITHLRLKLYEQLDSSSSVISSTTITHLFIKWIYIIDSTPAQILDYLDLPSLEALDLVASGRAAHDMAQVENHNVSIEHLISERNWNRFRRQLKSLHLSHIDITAYHDPLNLAPSAYFSKLEELELTQCIQFGLIIGSLADQERDAFPELQSLVIRTTFISPEDERTLSITKNLLLGALQFRASRRRLKFVKLAFPRPVFSPEDLQRVCYLKNEYEVDILIH